MHGHALPILDVLIYVCNDVIFHYKLKKYYDVRSLEINYVTRGQMSFKSFGKQVVGEMFTIYYTKGDRSLMGRSSIKGNRKQCFSNEGKRTDVYVKLKNADILRNSDKDSSIKAKGTTVKKTGGGTITI